MRRDRDRLLDILEAIDRIEAYSSRGRAAFEDDELIQTWVVHHLQIIGESAGRLSDKVRFAHREIPWAEIIAIRNILVHDYFRVDAEEVWTTVERDLPLLKRQVVKVVEKLGAE